MQKKQQYTIQDIARMTSVSKATVSRYLNGKFEYMSDDTRNRISATIAETGYRPNRMANSLKTNKSGLIGLVMSNISSTLTPFLVGSICDTCMRYGRKLIVVNSNDDEQDEIKLVRDLMDQQVDGLIVTSGYNVELYEQINSNNLPVVLVDRIPQSPTLDSVAINHKESVNKVINDLIDNGYENIYVISREHANPHSTIHVRERAAVSACKARFGDAAHHEVIVLHKMTSSKNLFMDNICSDDDIMDCLREKFEESKRHTVALFIVDASVLGRFVCAAYMLGISVSERFTIAGYDSLNYRNFIKPSICTIEQPLIKLGSVASERLIKRIDNPEEESQGQVLVQLLSNRIYK